MRVALTVDGVSAEVDADNLTLLEVLRDHLGYRAPKDGCSPQGQCGCCTVLVDGAPRVACVTPVRRVAGRSVTTSDGLDPEVRDRLVAKFVASGASQCGFCTPGILCRLAPLGDAPAPDAVERALLAHLCRCTGWRSIVAAACASPDGSGGPGGPVVSAENSIDVKVPENGGFDVNRIAGSSAGGHASGKRHGGERDWAAAGQRATLEGGTPQAVGPEVILGRGGFAEDSAPQGALVAVPSPTADDGWAVGETLAEARAAAGKIQGRRSGQAVTWPIEVPAGDWDLTLRTTWVEPGYLEPDASWCEPGGEPASPLANGGAFGGKVASAAPAAARALADRYGRAVRVVFSREDVVRLGPKRPPLAAGVRGDGTGVIRVVRTPGIAAAVASVAPSLVVEEVAIAGPATSAAVRGAGWVEAAVLLAACAGRAEITPGAGRAELTAPGGGQAGAEVTLGEGGHPSRIDVWVDAGAVLDEVVLRSYCTGAAHMALGWVTSEAIGVGPDGVVDDLTIRSFGILRARDTPEVNVQIQASRTEAVNGSDAVFAAVAAATWLARGLPGAWPTDRGTR